ncbi:MAG: DegQ family serine endoprotease [Candidatus Tectomicrobia bacterium]|nr:DegQ family serine endoprotease [Candidatus Tectomicrobia bacterium]
MSSKRSKTIWFSLLFAVLLAATFAAGLATAFVTGKDFPGRRSAWSVAQAQAAAPDVRQEAGGLPSFRPLVERLTPTVVNIRVVRKVERSSLSEESPFGEDPFPDFFRRFREGRPGRRVPPPEYRRQGVGSGFIYSRDGLIVTNQHVVEGAEDIRVTLSDGRTFSAKVLGRDAKTDLALLRITQKVDLPAVALGDSGHLAPGDWVLAIGNPFGLGHTVTAGIVSGKGRSIGAGPYDDFIQTDASINPGNSGGPLFNVRGEVVGVNTAILPNGQGIGFSIPINLAREVIASLQAKGYVPRAWLGVQIQNLTPELAKAFGMKKPRGALVADVLSGGPAERAGFRRGDVIVGFAGQEVEDARALPRMVASAPAGKKVKIQVLREGKAQEIEVALDEMKDDAPPPARAEKTGFHLGVQVRPLGAEETARLGLKADSALAVVSVQPGSPAERGGLRPGDVILEINGKTAGRVEDLRSAAAATQDKGLLLLVKRDRTNLYMAIPVG